METYSSMKTLLLMLALSVTVSTWISALAADKKPKTTPTQSTDLTYLAAPADPAASAKERQARTRLAMDFRRVADKLTADEVKAVQAIVAKHKTAKPAEPAAKPAKKK